MSIYETIYGGSSDDLDSDECIILIVPIDENGTAGIPPPPPPMVPSGQLPAVRLSSEVLIIMQIIILIKMTLSVETGLFKLDSLLGNCR